jgi:uncharacterized protein with HEPN domain
VPVSRVTVGKATLLRTLMHLWPYIWPYDRRDLKLRVFAATVLLFLAKLATIAVPFTFKWATDALVGQGSAPVAPSSWLAWAMAAPIAMTLAYGGMRIVMAVLGQMRDGIFADAIDVFPFAAAPADEVTRDPGRDGMRETPSPCGVQRDWRLYVLDMLACIDRVQRYTAGLGSDEFLASDIAVDAVTRNLEIIGEAISHVPAEIRDRYPVIPWARIRGIRNSIAHGYYIIDLAIVWSVIQNDLEPLRLRLQDMLRTEP